VIRLWYVLKFETRYWIKYLYAWLIEKLFLNEGEFFWLRTGFEYRDDWFWWILVDTYSSGGKEVLEWYLMKYLIFILCEHVRMVNVDNLVVKYYFDDEKFLHTMICGLNGMYWC